MVLDSLNRIFDITLICSVRCLESILRAWKVLGRGRGPDFNFKSLETILAWLCQQRLTISFIYLDSLYVLFL